ncbi:MAG TPA: glycoside hydrolase family 71/99-like protein [Pirellulales bacterium]|nr:glycoside hydrolase family 71/99-like protein [Pirellulales bacterium]
MSLNCSRNALLIVVGLLAALVGMPGDAVVIGEEPLARDTPAVDATTLRRKVLCGYQGWFRCPGDPAHEGWRHWSRDAKRIGPDTLTFEMWPDLSEYDDDEKYPAVGFTYPDGKPAQLFSSANSKTIDRHFRWMRQYGIDGVFVQHFAVDLPGGPAQDRYASRQQVLQHVIEAAQKTGRAWALSYDIAGMPGDKMVEVLTADWKKMVDAGVTAGPRYLQERGKPVVQVWGFYRNSPGNAMTPELAHRLIDFFKAEGPYSAYLLGGGDWQWRRDPEWQKIVFRFDAYAPWNVGNYGKDAGGVAHASTAWWEADKRACEEHGVLWLPVVYPGFSWDNLKRKPRGTSTIPRRGGEFFWEQFHELAKLDVAGVYIAMFDEVDEATAIFKVSNTPPTPGRFVTYDGLPADWYLRLAGEGAKLIRGERENQKAIPLKR